MRMAVTLHDLTGDRCDSQAHLLTDKLLNLWWNGSMRTYRTGNLAYCDLFKRYSQALLAAPQLIHPQSKFQSKGHRLRVNAMRAPHHQRILVLPCRLLDRLHQGRQCLRQQHSRLLQLGC